MQHADAANTAFYSTVNEPNSDGLNWLLAENAGQVARRARFRRPGHELDLAMMTRPLPPQTVYQLLGLAVGTLPPAAILARVFGYGFGGRTANFGGSHPVGIFFLCLMVNAVCALIGYLAGRLLASSALNVGRGTWNRMVVMLILLGALWGLMTGVIGGFFLFGIGAVVGPGYTIPIGVASFLIFGLMHRLLERGGMIEARHFLPLVLGIASVISVFIAKV